MRQRTFTLAVALALVAGALPAPAPGAAHAAEIAPQSELWREVDETALAAKRADRRVSPSALRVLHLDEAALGELLERAPLELTEAAKAGAPVLLPVPMPDGSLQRFRIQESPVMEPELAARFPEIRTYVAQGVDDPAATARFDRTPLGFHAQVLSPAGAVYVDPYLRGDTSLYASYYKRDLPRDERDDFRCLVEDEAGAERAAAPASLATGQTLRTYRLALACTGEYSTAVANANGQPVSVDTSMAAMVTSVNRVVGIYEVDLAVRMVLVANNVSLVFTSGASDPYTNGNGTTMLSENQSYLDGVIGSASYDIGHVFSTGGGGVAGLGVVCRAGNKARGVTGRGTPVGDPFDVDYVAHEMGHQFGGRHTFNGTAGSCGGFNRSATAAYEPGSGSTIQAYAGICSTVNLQPNSDPYFHGYSLDEMVAYTNSGSGNGCAVQTATGNLEPTVDAGPTYTIPASTPFELTASASDPNGDALTYCWEQLDLGPALNTNTDNGSSPIFRSFNPTTSPTRQFPKVSDLVNNTTTFGEVLPTTNRTLSFRCTVRDNRAGGGGVAFDSTSLAVTTAAGPFAVTSPNAPTTWAGGSTQTVTWSVANTSGAPVSAPNVSVLLSLDGGFTFPVVLLAITPNDGSQTITVPNLPTSLARIKVKGAGHVFFDVSNANFTITAGAAGGDSPGIYLDDTGTFFLRNSNAAGAADSFFGYGPAASALVPLAGDWDGNHTDTPGVYDPVTGVFFLKNSNAPGGADLVFSFGPGGAGITPLRGDWNGDGIDTVGIYVASSGTFFLRNANAPGGADVVVGYGPAGLGFVPLSGDWNADLRDTVGLYDPASGFFFLRNTNTPGPAELVFSFGAGGATPLAGDWNLDGRDTVGVYLPGSGFYFLRNTNTPGAADVAFGYGPPGSRPLAGDWDGL